MMRRWLERNAMVPRGNETMWHWKEGMQCWVEMLLEQLGVVAKIVVARLCPAPEADRRAVAKMIKYGRVVHSDRVI